jgi:hypothetical protein
LLRGVLTGAVAGMLAGAVALGVAEPVSGITGPLGAPVVAVGGVAIDHTPVRVKEFAIQHFGTHDKDVLISGILVLLAAPAAGPRDRCHRHDPAVASRAAVS